MKKDLGEHPYKIVLTQELKLLNHRTRRGFADFVLEQLENDNDFLGKSSFPLQALEVNIERAIHVIRLD